MNLYWLKLTNFRQFYGKSPKIEFSSGDRNVTVIHGCNGSGKTAILNAFTWALFGEFSSGFLHREHIVNKRAVREASIGEVIEASIEIKFEHVGKLYILIKRYQVTRINSNDLISKPITNGPQMQWADIDGNWKEVRTPSEVIEGILPKELYFYFFFDGERIEKFFNPSKQDINATSNALKQFLGIELLERAERHLALVAKVFQDELKKIGDSETKQIIEKIENFEEKLKQNKKEYENIEKSIEVEIEQKEKIEDFLRDKEETAELQNELDRLKVQGESIKKEEKSLKKTLSKLISRKAYLIFLNKPIQNYENIENKLRKAGELPSGIKKQFVKDLLKREECICGTKLQQNSNQRKKLEDWLNRAGLAEVEERLIKLGGRLSNLKKSKVQEFYVEVSDSLAIQSWGRTVLSELENKFDRIDKKIGKSPSINIRNLKNRQKKAVSNISDFKFRLGGIDTSIKRIESDIREFRKELEKREEKQYESLLARRRMKAARNAQDVLKKMLKSMELTNISQIDKKLKERFKSMAPHLPYIPELTDNLEIKLYEKAGGKSLPVAASQGESQLVSFVFLATIIEYAREWQKKKDNIKFVDSSKYPIVMDSPFGSLDSLYRKQVSDLLPNVADQVIILVTQTQWRGEVEENTYTKIGKQYVLQYYSPEENTPDEVINIGNRSYPLIKKSICEYEYTEIMEVENG